MEQAKISSLIFSSTKKQTIIKSIYRKYGRYLFIIISLQKIFILRHNPSTISMKKNTGVENCAGSRNGKLRRNRRHSPEAV
jgi:hypothetical protein